MITITEIYHDLESLYKKYGVKIILVICAVSVYTHNWYNWREIKSELLNEFKEAENEGKKYNS